MAKTPGEAGSASLRLPGAPLVLAWALFLASRLFILVSQPERSDVEYVYARYALEYDLALRHGASLYEVHRELAQREAANTATAGEHRGAERAQVEYPPFAILTLLWPRAFMDDLPGDGTFPEAAWRQYVVAYRTEMAVADLLAFAILALLVSRWFGPEPPWQARRALAGLRRGRLRARPSPV